MRLLVEAANGAVAVEGGRIVVSAGPFDCVLRVPDGELRPGLINAHEHLHRNHYGRLGNPPYPNAEAWGRDIHARHEAAIRAGRAVPRRDALLRGAWKNLLAGVTTVVHHDAWESDFDAGFPIRVARVRCRQSPGADQGLVAGSDAGPLAIHLAEGTDAGAAEEVRELDRRGLLTRELLAVHVVGADGDGVRRLRQRGAAIVWCPTSNHFLFGRTAPAELLAPGMDVLLGSDSLLTGDGDLLDELRAARSLGLVSDQRLEQAVGSVAARRLGLPTPSLEAGAPADLVVLRRPLLEASAADVAVVVVEGVIRVLDPALVGALGGYGARGTIIEMASGARWVQPAPASQADARARSGRTPVVSVVLPTYNREALLRQAVASVLAQTFTDWELIVADDGSTDGTRAWLEGLDDQRIRPLFLEHSGTPTRPRIAAVAAARGEWIGFLDSDDLWLPAKLATQLAQLADRPTCRWSYTGYRHVNAQGDPIPPRPPRPFVPHSGWILEPLLRYEAAAWIVTWLVRRSLLEEAGGFDPAFDMRSDFELALRLAARSEAHAVPETLAVLRDHGGRTTSGRRVVDLFRANERVFRKAAASAPSARIRRLCRRQCGVHLAGMATALSREGEHRAAFGALGRAVRDAPLSPKVWRAIAGCGLRAAGLRGTAR